MLHSTHLYHYHNSVSTVLGKGFDWLDCFVRDTHVTQSAENLPKISFNDLICMQDVVFSKEKQTLTHHKFLISYFSAVFMSV